MPSLQDKTPMSFEWTEVKRRTVIQRHGIDFKDAVRIFDGPVLEIPSPRMKEARWLAIGILDGIEIVVGYTIQDGRRRINTARRARTYEQRKYHACVIGGDNPP